VRKLLLLLLALLAVRLMGRAIRKQAEVSGLLWAVIALTASSTANTSKTYAIEQRVAALVVGTGSAAAAAAAAQATANTAASSITTMQSQIAQLQNGVFNAGTLNNIPLLSGISRQVRPGTVQSAPSSYTLSWGQNTQNTENSLIASLEAMGLMT
jgi:hypothetical protein